MEPGRRWHTNCWPMTEMLCRMAVTGSVANTRHTVRAAGGIALQSSGTSARSDEGRRLLPLRCFDGS